MIRGQSLYDWCQVNGEFGKQILYEFGDGNNSQIFLDEEIGLEMTPHDFSRSSNKKIYWTCKEGHKWQSVINDRVRKMSKCPYCLNKKVLFGYNDFQTWCQNNGKYGQQLMQEWVGLDENNNPIDMHVLTYGSYKKVQWRCNKGHQWIATISNRNKGRSCPYCFSNHVAREDNRLDIWCKNNGDFGQQLLQEWVGLDENNNTININEVSYGSTKKVQWKCVQSHTWSETINNRTSKNSGCPYCIGKKVSDKNSFLRWCKHNEDFGQQLLQEWTGLDENNNSIGLDAISYGSQKKVIWKCIKNHTWIAPISNRTFGKVQCPYCNTKGTSFPEQFIYHSLKQIFPNAITRGRYKGYEYDITIPEIRLCIEYSGFGWHKDKLDRDEEKKKLCKEHRVNFLQIYAHYGQIKYRNGTVVNDSYTKEQIIYRANNNKELHKIQLILLVEFILKQYAPEHTISEINFAQAESDAYAIIQGNY